jgi:NTE family protein
LRHSRQVGLALQGGGAHGAFTWGVLDRLLEDERIVIEAISGTSAGAMNAAALATRLAAGKARGRPWTGSGSAPASTRSSARFSAR